ncbi:MAG: hypothetical protein IPG44_16015 [Anaerolineales bacterium]|nr:hypothetical protein [Anaerolineales bacterium]
MSNVTVIVTFYRDALRTLKPLFDAQSMGYRIGVLQSSEMGFDNYKRLGFRHLCQIENFFLQIR